MANQNIHNDIDCDVDEWSQINNPDNVEQCTLYDISKINSILKKQKKSSGIFILHVNMRSIQKNKHKLEELLNNLSTLPTIILVSETKISSTQIPFDINIDTYNFYHNDTNTKAGGVGIYIQKCITTSIRQDLEIQINEQCENLWIEILNNKGPKTVIGVIYRHPDPNISNFQKAFTDTLETLQTQNTVYYIGGDFNIDLQKQNTNKIRRYISDIHSAGSCLPINQPTRYTPHSQPATLDHFYTNILNKHIIPSIIEYDISDHLPIALLIPHGTLQQTNTTFKKRDTRNFRVDQFLNDLDNSLSTTFCQLPENALLEDEFKLFTTTFLKILDQHAPLRTQTRKEQRLKKKTWITSGILKSIKTKNRMLKTHYQSNNTKKIEIYKKYNNHLTRLKKASKQLTYQQHINNANSSAQTWKIIKKIANNAKSPQQIKQITVNGQILTEPKEIAQSLNQHFTTIGESLASRITHTNASFKDYLKGSIVNSFYLSPTNDFEIKKYINILKQNKAEGPHHLPIHFFKLSTDIIAPYLTYLYNKCFTTFEIPQFLKITNITPIPKNKNPTQASDFRPISITPVLSKLLEKLIIFQLNKFLTKHNIISQHQFGFRKNHTTALLTADLYENMLNSTDQGKYHCTVFMDLSKAFDTVDHNILITKLQHYGIRGGPLNLLKNFITNRLTSTKFLNEQSNHSIAKYGLPQGCILSPVLFQIYTNDLPTITNIPCKMYADDSIFFCSENSLGPLQQTMNMELVKITHWMSANKLSLNIDKTHFMLIEKRKSPATNFKLQINNTYLHRANTVRYLGIHFDDKLTWKNHIAVVEAKISQSIGMLYKIRKYLNSHTLKILYHALIHSHLQYGSINWGRACKSHLVHLQALQNKAIRAITHSTIYTHIIPLFKEQNILQIKHITELEILKYMHKYQNGLLPSAFKNLLHPIADVHTHHTRLHDSQNFFLPTVLTNSGQKQIKFLGPKLWETIHPPHKSLNLKLFTKQVKNKMFEDYQL